jgi:ABC-type transport system involved in cytochrome c biogenesis permease component
MDALRLLGLLFSILPFPVAFDLVVFAASPSTSISARCQYNDQLNTVGMVFYPLSPWSLGPGLIRHRL